MDDRSSRHGWFSPAEADPTTLSLRATVLDCLQPGKSPKAAEFWQDVLADHIRNQHRKALDMECHVARWDRKAPEIVVMYVEQGEAT